MSTVQRKLDTSGVTTLTLNRPQVHNAFDEVMIDELKSAIDEIDADADTRVVVLRASGKSFSAGADLNWMRRVAKYDESENRDEAMRLAQMMLALNRLSKPVIAVVQGATYGGGVGLVACCDIAIASDQARFCLSEVKLGLVPAVISPYVISAIGERAARRYMLSAEIFDAAQAQRLGLVHEVAADHEIEQIVADVCASLLAGGPSAQATAKALIARIAAVSPDESVALETAQIIASCRASSEGQEGLAAFFDKRKPDWVK